MSLGGLVGRVMAVLVRSGLMDVSVDAATMPAQVPVERGSTGAATKQRRPRRRQQERKGPPAAGGAEAEATGSGAGSGAVRPSHQRGGGTGQHGHGGDKLASKRGVRRERSAGMGSAASVASTVGSYGNEAEPDLAVVRRWAEDFGLSDESMGPGGGAVGGADAACIAARDLYAWGPELTDKLKEGHAWVPLEEMAVRLVVLSSMSNWLGPPGVGDETEAMLVDAIGKEGGLWAAGWIRVLMWCSAAKAVEMYTAMEAGGDGYVEAEGGGG